MENNTSVAPIKKHQILKYIIDNDLIQRHYDKSRVCHVCLAIREADQAFGSTQSYAAYNLSRNISISLHPAPTVQTWLRTKLNIPYSKLYLRYAAVHSAALIQYKKDWVQAMYEACLERDE